MADQQPFVPTELELHVVTPDTTLYKGKVRSISGKNSSGPFDILTYHTNFVSIINGSITVHELNGNKKEIPIGSGIVKVYRNVIYIFVGIEQQQPGTPGQ